MLHIFSLCLLQYEERKQKEKKKKIKISAPTKLRIVRLSYLKRSLVLREIRTSFESPFSHVSP